MDERTISMVVIWSAMAVVLIATFVLRVRIQRATDVRKRLGLQIKLATWALFCVGAITVGAITLLTKRMRDGDNQSLWLAVVAGLFAAFLIYRITVVRRTLYMQKRKLEKENSRT